MWSRSRLLEHLGKSMTCRFYYSTAMDEEPAEAVQNEVLAETLRVRGLRRAGRRATWADKPCVRLVGPLPAVVGDRQTPAMCGTHGIGKKRHLL